MLWTWAFWRGAAERALKTLLQTFGAVLVGQVGADTVGVSAGILAPDWVAALSIALLAAVISLIMSVGNADFVAGHQPAPEPSYEPDPALSGYEPGPATDEADLP